MQKGFDKQSYIIPYTGIQSTKQINVNFVLQINKRKFINGNRNIDTAGFANHECKGINCKFSNIDQTKYWHRSFKEN